MANSLDYRWIRGAYQSDFPRHTYPENGWNLRPWWILICPQECDYTVTSPDPDFCLTAGPMEVILIPSQTRIRVHQHQKGAQTYAHFCFTVSGSLDPLTLYKFPRKLSQNSGSSLRNALWDFAAAHSRKRTNLEEIAHGKESAFRLLRELIHLGTFDRSKSVLFTQYSRIRKAIEYIESNLPNPIRQKDLAACVHLSPSRFQVVFRELMGQPPMRYVRELRQRRAVELLHDTQLSIGAIADHCGFCDQFEFSRQFKRAWGSSPNAYRRALHQATNPYC